MGKAKTACSTFVVLLSIVLAAFFLRHPWGRAILAEHRRVSVIHNPIETMTDIWSPDDVATLLRIARETPMDSFSASDSVFGFPPNEDGFTCPHQFLKLDICRPPVCEVPTKRCVVPAVTSIRGAPPNASWEVVNDLLRKGSKRYMMRLYLIGDPLEGDDVVNAPDAVPLMQNKVLIENAKKMYPDYPIIVPRLLYFNVVLPGQEVGMHADVPTFRGLNRLQLDTKFLVCSHLSGYFDDYRVRIATAVTYIGNSTRRDIKGGDFTFFPNGPYGRRVDFKPEFNTGVVLDTDSAMHRVPVCQPDHPERHVPPFNPMHTWLVWAPEANKWHLRENSTTIAEYDDDDLRLSLSWKAYFFKSQEDHDMWAAKENPLTVTTLLETYRQNFIKEGLMTEEAGYQEFLHVMAVRGVYNWVIHHYRFFDSWVNLLQGRIFGGGKAY